MREVDRIASMASKKRNPESLEPVGQPGPEPERLKLEGDWADRVDDALRKKKPADGWPGAKKPGKGKSDKKKSG